jgi:hypothetical protein
MLTSPGVSVLRPSDNPLLGPRQRIDLETVCLDGQRWQVSEPSRPPGIDAPR